MMTNKFKDRAPDLISDPVVIGAALIIAIIAISLALYIFDDDSISGAEIDEYAQAMHSDCQSVFSAKVRHQIMTEQRPLDEHEIEELSDQFSAMDAQTCESMNDQMSMGATK